MNSTEVSTADVRGCAGGNVSLSADGKWMLDLHNKTRAARGLPKFCVHPALQRAARAHSKEMIDEDYFKHNPPVARRSGTVSRASVKTGGPLVRIFSTIRAH